MTVKVSRLQSSDCKLGSYKVSTQWLQYNADICYWMTFDCLGLDCSCIMLLLHSHLIPLERPKPTVQHACCVLHRLSNDHNDCSLWFTTAAASNTFDTGMADHSGSLLLAQITWARY